MLTIEMEKNKVSLFADIWSHLSPESKEIVTQHPDFEQYEHWYFAK
jgi:hypothetical protein